MSTILSEAVDIKDLSQGRLVTIYGKSSSGKTEVGASFPKPMLYLRIGDDGSSTIKNKDGIDAIEVKSTGQLKSIYKELLKDKKYASVFTDTFSLIVSEWKNENIVSKQKKMTQQSWGDLLTETEELVRMAHEVSKKGKWVILSGHEVTDTIEGMEDELLPDVRMAVSKGARTYLEGMTNIGIHTIKVQKEREDPDGNMSVVVKYAADIGPNPYYWTKFQIDSTIKLPRRMFNPTYDKLMKIIGE